jgi:hypothetical protein
MQITRAITDLFAFHFPDMCSCKGDKMFLQSLVNKLLVKWSLYDQEEDGKMILK